MNYREIEFNLWFGSHVWWKCFIVSTLGVLVQLSVGIGGLGFLGEVIAAPLLFPIESLLALEEIREFLLALSMPSKGVSGTAETAELLARWWAFILTYPISVLGRVVGLSLSVLIGAAIWNFVRAQRRHSTS